ncbi:MAG: helicase associated domain-containing protein [Prosthecobacter sp.]
MPSRRSDIHEQDLVIYAEWEWNYSQVEAFVRARGHCNLGEHPAGDWLRQQLQASTAGKLSPERQQRLASLGVSLDPGDGAWEAMLQRVRDVLIRRRVPRKKGREKWLPEPLDGDMAAWLREQRALDKARLLHPDRRSKLLGLKLLVVKRMPDPPPEPSRGSILAAEARERRHAALWESRYAELVAYKHEYGDCDVPKDWPENKPLANWVRFQRKLDHLGRMTEAHRSRLDALDFVWRLRSLPVDKRWERRFQELVQYKEAHGHTRVPKSFDWQLWHWRHVQREFRRKGIMNPVRIARLDAIGFEWEEDPVWGRSWDPIKEKHWDAKLQQLAEYRAQHGNINVPHHGKEYTKLGSWLNRQRIDCRNGHLRPDRLARLEALGFVASPGRPSLDEYWDERYAELAAFHQQHGHTRVTSRVDNRLSEWRYLQRANHRKGLLSAERIARLDALGFEWVEPESSGLTQQERWDRQWLGMYEQLVQFQREHGHCHVLRKWEGNPRLAEWVQDQRALKSQGKLRPERLTRLEALGFLWTAESIDSDSRWERRFQQLCDYQRQHGHTRVPKGFDRQLWHWRHVQREFRRKGMLKPDRIARLDAIGFEWDEQGKPWAKSREDRWERQWDAMYAQLVEFQHQHGTTHVVAGWPENPRLATWVGDQREREHHGGLRPDRKARLEAISFVWNPGRPTLVAKWEERYAQLVAFKEQHGHTRVPKGFDRQLWRWRHAQREFRKKNMVSAERIEKLDSIGFEWEGRDPA